MGGTSIKPALSRVRPPRVRILPSLGDVTDLSAVELPFHIAAIAPLVGDSDSAVPYRERRFIEIDHDNFAQVFERMAPHLRFLVDNKLSDDPDAPGLSVDLHFRGDDQFGPYGVAQQVPALRELLELRSHLAELARMIHRNDKAEELIMDASSNPKGDSDFESLGRLIAQEAHLARTAEDASFVGKCIATYLVQFRSGQMVLSRDLERSIWGRIAQLDHLLSLQVNEIIHAPEFQALEATWRGLAHLVREAETTSTHRIYVLNARPEEILHDIRCAAEFRDMDLYAKLAEPLDTLGGAPYGCVVVAYSFARHPENLEMLETLARIGSTLCAPVLTAPCTEFSVAPNGNKVPMLASDIRWKAFRDREYSRFLVMVQPRMLLRLPYGRDTQPIEEFHFEEHVDGTDSSRYLWGNSAWALAGRISAAWTTYGWCAAIQSRDGGGLVQDLPVHSFGTDEGDVQSHPSTEFIVTEKMEGELFDLGFCSLCQYSQRAEAVFPRVPTCRRPGRYLDAEANWNDRFGSQLPFVLSCCRFALAVRLIVRDNRGSFTSPEHCAQTLNKWLMRYVSSDESAGVTAEVAFPLREARIAIDRAADRDHWVAALFIRPHFQLDGLTVPLRVLVDLAVS